ncbi:YceD family protein [Shimia biformata]|uniref:YceD family protein n=1 Tax=Shimia biformata TaxID=1294299 RepID=UPI0019529026|nr:DUF177 domain-containing protein [Shimia biformata]
MAESRDKSRVLRVVDLAQNQPTPFEITPDRAELDALGDEMGVVALRKLRFKGALRAEGKRDWRLSAEIGFTVVQPCVVTLDHVTTRVDAPVERLFLAEWHDPEEEDAEVEMDADESIEPLKATIDLGAILAEALALNLPLYPRKEDASLGEAVFTEPGKKAMTDEETKPFAGLSALKDQLKKDGEK